MPRIAVRLLFIVVCLAILVETGRTPSGRNLRKSQSPESSSRRPKLRNPIRAVTNAAWAISNMAPAANRAVNPVRGGSSDRSSSRTSRSLSAPTGPPSQVYSAFPSLPYTWEATNRHVRGIILRFAKVHPAKGESGMKIEDFEVIRDELMDRARDDSCHTKIGVKYGGHRNCADALRAYQKIRNDWRGACSLDPGGPFAAWCHPWPNGAGGVRRCSIFFIRTDSVNPPLNSLQGYLLKLEDVAGALYNDLPTADSFFDYDKPVVPSAVETALGMKP